MKDYTMLRLERHVSEDLSFLAAEWEMSKGEVVAFLIHHADIDLLTSARNYEILQLLKSELSK